MPTRPPMKGWKTWTAAGLAVAYGLVGWLAGVHDVEVGMGFLVGGLGMVGLGHKVSVLTDLLAASAPPPPPQRRASDHESGGAA